ncbi:MAG TPA: glycosyltransferase [Methylomirabilota bacterium]|nr:glycosyltransferase [Methylomirabilota bacterium]
MQRDADAALVVNTFNDADFLPEALESALAQTVPFAEIVVVDDGSRESPQPVVAQFPGVRLISQVNAGLAAARNTGLAEVSAPYVAFLDSDDLLRPNAVADGLAAHATHPGMALVYGAHVRVDAGGARIGPDRYTPIGDDAYATLLRGNAIAMHAAVLYDRAALQAAGGFDASLRRCEDYDLYLRMARGGRIASHPAVVAAYRRHSANMSVDLRAMLGAVLAVHDRHRHVAVEQPDWSLAFDEGRTNWRNYYAVESLRAARDRWSDRSDPVRLARDLAGAASISPATLVREGRRRLAQRFRPRSRPLHRVRLGDLATTVPVSLDFGYDRGTPVDRYYIARFLADNAMAIAGRALEIGDASYCERFGRGVTRQDVLHVHAENPAATIVGDLSDPDVLPPDTFDSMVLTQTLHLLFDLPAAVASIHRALKPGGTALVTVPGISPIDRGEWGATWYWSLTAASARRLFEPLFGAGRVTVETHGNVYAATCFLHGLALEETDKRKLDEVDPSYPVVVTIVASKALST